MKNVLVKSLKNNCFMIGNEVIEAFRPTVITSSSRVEALVFQGLLKILSEVTDEATDEEFEKFYVDHDRKEDEAVENFLSKFAVKDEEEVEVKPKTRAKKA